jgi:lipoyl(octanoyl) transferase
VEVSTSRNLDGQDLGSRPRPTWLIAPEGLAPYGLANEAMHRLAERRLVGEIPDTLILLEHPPVFTAGRRAKSEHLVWTEDEAAARGAQIHHIDRGGSFTFHGPGQLVGYPILHLGSRPDVARYLRLLEEAVIRTGADLGVDLHRRKDVQTGVFHGEDKVCAIGVRLIRTRVTLHGFAINCDTDLSWFEGIVACGLPENGVTSLSHVAGRPIVVDEVRSRVGVHLGEIFGLSNDPAPTSELIPFLAPGVATRELLPPPCNTNRVGQSGDILSAARDASPRSEILESHCSATVHRR